jgi:hemin uptake protein HemP
MERASRGSSAPAGPETSPARTTDSRSVSSRELLGSEGRLDILHNGEVYRLRVTRQKKLILTK